ncbi:hypothetical protein PCC7418_0862 [Halothece sp. PCC 7418]|uniref:hypothetical protein n=1 Tax=Halothece sp. (strain PCC 7418) TaxID=65093 RepID=UPI0002A06814|nr:hypothetical protein [Halothece sp. PCC 7418]AFZ43077.1 hypothetical protein PCC7418_0862 [Halothece sp. PCC 7418]
MKHLFSVLFGILILITLSSCQDFSPRNPQVSSNHPSLDATSPSLEAFDLAAENWQTIAGEGITLSLPETYLGGNPVRDLTNIETALTDLDQSYEKRLQPIKQNLEQTVLIAFDARSLTANALTNVNVVQQSLNQQTSLEDYLAKTVQQLQATHQIEEETILTQNKSSMGRIIASVTTEEGVSLKQLFYLQPQKETVWITTYTTPSSEFQGRFPNFEQSIASLDIQA